MALSRHSLGKKRVCAWVYNQGVQTVKTDNSMVPDVPGSELGSDYRWLIHWWPLGPRLVAYVASQIIRSEHLPIIT